MLNNSKYRKQEEKKKPTPKHIMIKLLKTSDKGKNHKSSFRKKKRHYILRVKDEDDSTFLTGNNISKRSVE